MALKPKRISLLLLGVAAVAIFHYFSPSQETASTSEATEEVTAPDVTNLSALRKTNALEKAETEKKRREEYEAQLKNEGWKPVTTDQPDQEVLDLSLDALRSKPEKVKMHLLSNSFSGESLDRIRDIALDAPDKELRFIALEALGKSPDSGAQTSLIDCYGKLQEPEAKQQILSYIRPKNIDDSSARFLFDVLDDPNASDAMKRQAAFPLVVASAIEAGETGKSTRTGDVLTRTPANYREQMTAIIQQLLEAK